MLVSLDIHRLRHVRKQVAGNDPKQWEEFKGAVDGVGALVVGSGLVHALLMGLKKKSGNDKAPMKPAVDALAAWLQDTNCPVRQRVAKALENTSGTQVADEASTKLAVALMELPTVPDAMAIQAEAVRYLAQAKLLANAFKGSGDEPR